MTISSRNAIVIVVFLTLARIAMLASSSLYLLPDEAQYWAWSRELDWGYFSKPPMVAWLIHFVTAIGGTSEFWVRLASPVMHGATALLMIPLAASLGWDERKGFWAAVAYATLPMVSFSSMFMTTDVPLLFFWALALLSFRHACNTGKPGWAVAAGAAVGFGLLAKYAMVYFILGGAIYLAADASARKRLGLRGMAISVLAALLGFVPNILWNMGHDWLTFSHTAGNANFGGALFSLREGAIFALSQFAVFGPFFMVALLFSIPFLAAHLKGRGEGALSPALSARIYLHAFTWPPLVLMVALSFVSRANANWAALSYIGGLLLVLEWILIGARRGWIEASLLLHCALMLVLFALSLEPLQRTLPPPVNVFAAQQRFGLAGRIVAQRVSSFYPGITVMADERKIMASLVYALRDVPTRVRMWPYDREPANHFELAQRLTRDEGKKVLWITTTRNNPLIVGKFDALRVMENIDPTTSSGGKDRYYIIELDNYRP